MFENWQSLFYVLESCGNYSLLITVQLYLW
nr:MAG TPA: hypothetical protein [Caudoviricetes sp.]DAT46853.1 MAG TPA: hypothetical protein [Caudoviricetes sp.]